MIKYCYDKNKYFTRRLYQLIFSFDTDYMIAANDPVRLLSQLVEKLDLTDLYSTYYRIRENQVMPTIMLKILIYAYMNRLYSSRDIEKACNRDTSFMFLFEGASALDHSTIARFRRLHFAPCVERILKKTTNFHYEIGEISGKAIFIDGTKIEAYANKYTFVWKKVATKKHGKIIN